MQAIQSFIDFTQSLGAACMMPIFVFIIGLIVRVPFKQLLKASITVGCGFIGTFMVMDLLAKYIGPISNALVQRFNLSLDVVDVGWPVTGSFSWAVPIAPVIFVAVFALNILLIVVGYILGIGAKLTGHFSGAAPLNYVFAVYIINLVMVSANIVVYFRNRKLDIMKK